MNSEVFIVIFISICIIVLLNLPIYVYKYIAIIVLSKYIYNKYKKDKEEKEDRDRNQRVKEEKKEFNNLINKLDESKWNLTNEMNIKIFEKVLSKADYIGYNNRYRINKLRIDNKYYDIDKKSAEFYFNYKLKKNF